MIMLEKTGARVYLILTTSIWSDMTKTENSILTCNFYKFGHSMFLNMTIE